MGKLIWNDWAHLLGLTSATYALWASFWGILYRKFFWVMIDNQGLQVGVGLIPGPNSTFFDEVIVTIPLVQIFTMILSVVILVIEFAPLQIIRKSFAYRNFMFKASLYFGLAFLCLLFYQGINAGAYSIVTIIAYTRAQVRGEMIPEQKENRGRAERV